MTQFSGFWHSGKYLLIRSRMDSSLTLDEQTKRVPNYTETTWKWLTKIKYDALLLTHVTKTMSGQTTMIVSDANTQHQQHKQFKQH